MNKTHKYKQAYMWPNSVGEGFSEGANADPDGGLFSVCTSVNAKVQMIKEWRVRVLSA
jgi:hypothetical protein